MEDTLAMHSSPSESCQWRWRHSTLVRSSEDCWHCTRAWGKRWDILQPWLQIFERLHALCSSFWLVAVIHKTCCFFSTRMQGSIFSSFLPMSLMLHWICAEYPFPSLPFPRSDSFHLHVHHQTPRAQHGRWQFPNSTLYSPLIVISLSRRQTSVQLCHTSYI